MSPVRLQCIIWALCTFLCNAQEFASDDLKKFMAEAIGDYEVTDDQHKEPEEILNAENDASDTAGHDTELESHLLRQTVNVAYDDGHDIGFTNGITAKRDDDLILSEEQEDWLFNGEETTNNISKRAGTEMASHVMFWPNGRVPYLINPKHFDRTEHRQIKEAMSVWEDLTCLQFTPVSRSDRQWIHLQHTNDGCWSLLGMASRIHPGGQPISLQKPGCRDFGTYLHEIGHAIGLVHEHQLPTRDQHVRYHTTNVDPDQISQLKMYSKNVINTYNTPYDLGSIMHYDILSFSVDDVSPTLGIDNPWLAVNIGRRNSHMLSFGDARTINSLYRCHAQCSPADVKRCPYPGYVNRKCECITPQIFYNRYCTNTPDLEKFCYSLVPEGKCDIENYEHHSHCSKACGFCPRFLPGDSAIGLKQFTAGQTCIDRYHEPMRCRQWASYCAKSTWMKRYCRRTCGACQSPIGDCPNYDEDQTCDRYARDGLCKADTRMKRFVQARCQDSCGTCNFKRKDRSCSDELRKEECKKMAMRDGCEKNPIVMFQKCPSTCNRCYWNKGNCSNKASDKVCLTLALQNFCTNGHGKEAMMARQQCPRTCNTCRSRGK